MTTVAEPRPRQAQYTPLCARLPACSPASAAAGSASGSRRADTSAAMGAAAGLLPQLLLLLLLLGACLSLLCLDVSSLPGRRSCCFRPWLLQQAGARWRRAGQPPAPRLGALVARSWGWGRRAAELASIMLL